MAKGITLSVNLKKTAKKQSIRKVRKGGIFKKLRVLCVELCALCGKFFGRSRRIRPRTYPGTRPGRGQYLTTAYLPGTSCCN